MDLKISDILETETEEELPEEESPQEEDEDLVENDEILVDELPIEDDPGEIILGSQIGLMACSGVAGIVGLIGRDNELRELQTRLDRRQSVLIFGERFIGKTVLLEQLYQTNAHKKVVFIRQSKPLATLFETLFIKLYEWNMIYSTGIKQDEYEDFDELWKTLRRQTTAVKINILEQILTVHRNIVFLVDDVDSIPITGERLLSVIVSYGSIIGTARDKKQSIMSIYFRSLRLGLGGLSEANIDLIARDFLRLQNISIQDETHLVKHLRRAVGGSPGAASDLLYSLANEPTVTREKARALTHKAGTSEINIGLFWVLLSVLLAAFRVYGMKTGNLPVVIGGTIILMFLMIFRGTLLKGIQQQKK
ncbi:MAG: ATP-binding protein [SAR324 cluster bacterium]|nr:ATP-binding protein [SAR324 cluster bacterium]